MAAPPAAPLSPARLSRLQEKEELRALNDRLAVYIDRVRALELENDRLQLKISEREEVTTREVTGIKTLYEAELGDARRLLDETARERARLQIELGRLRAESEEGAKSAQKRESELAVAAARGRELEARVQRAEAQLAEALGDRQRLEGELAGLRGQLSKAEDGLAVARRQLEQETLARVDLENRCLSLREELGFQTSVFQEEVRETRRLRERPAEAAGEPREQEAKLARALQELRGHQEQQVQLCRQELARAWEAKLEAARLSEEQEAQAAGAAREQLQEAWSRLEALGSQLAGLQRQASKAEERARELEAQLAAEREAARAGQAARAQEAAELRAAVDAALAERQELLGEKLALDLEIRAYRHLLEGEEQRLQLTPSPSPRTSSSGSSVASLGRPGRGKRKRPSQPQPPEESPLGPGSGLASGSSGLGAAGGGVSIVEVDAQGRFVRLLNAGPRDQALGGWRLARRGPGSEGPERGYRFSPKFVLRTGQAVTVWAAGAGAEHSPPGSLVWRGQSSWGPAGGAHTVLFGPDGEEVAAVKPLEAENGEEAGEDGAELGEEDLFHQQGDPRTTSRGCRVM